MTFNKEDYWRRRKLGLKGQQPMTTKEIRQEVKKKLTKDMKPKLQEKILTIVNGEQVNEN